MSSLGKRLIAAAKEARLIAKGRADKSTYRVVTAKKRKGKAVQRALKREAA